MFGIKTLIKELRELKDFDDKVVNLLRRQTYLLEKIEEHLRTQTNLMQG